MRRQPQNGDLSKLHGRPARIAALRDKQALGTITAVPGAGPQVSSLQKLAGHGAAVLPQVRPKTLIPDSLPITPGRERPPRQPPTFQKASVVSVKNPGPALPTANNTVTHGAAPSGQPQALSEPAAVACPLSGAGVAYAIISSAPSNAAAGAPNSASTVAVLRDGIKVQPLLISADNKVILLQPQVQPEGSAQPRPPPEEPAQGAQDDQPVSQETPEKLAFMVALGLVTTEHLEEIQNKRQERKRRSTANPAYSGLPETEVGPRSKRSRGCGYGAAPQGRGSPLFCTTGPGFKEDSGPAEATGFGLPQHNAAPHSQSPSSDWLFCGPNNVSPPFLPVLANEDPCWKQHGALLPRPGIALYVILGDVLSVKGSLALGLHPMGAENEISHDEHCAVCKRGADLQPCGTCSGSYHLSCLEPPIKATPKGVWMCPRCQQKALRDEDVPWSGMLAVVHSYVTHKTVKEEEKQKLLQRGSELQSEHRQMEARDRRLASAVKVHGVGGAQGPELRNSQSGGAGFWGPGILGTSADNAVVLLVPI
ncbi:PHD finger protein 21B [Suncus etruscus]|uniref:PHD finger protein 21B n=1 Tax=Suncus etruscus TaxID=109475 RepID=UPI00210FB1D2|nr:PHD finger protein 21B [Suncus etruscus]